MADAPVLPPVTAETVRCLCEHTRGGHVGAWYTTGMGTTGQGCAFCGCAYFCPDPDEGTTKRA